jgi:hypothetical protein
MALFVLVDELLEVLADHPEAADDDVGARSAVRGNVSSRIGHRSIRRVVSNASRHFFPRAGDDLRRKCYMLVSAVRGRGARFRTICGGRSKEEQRRRDNQCCSNR